MTRRYASFAAFLVTCSSALAQVSAPGAFDPPVTQKSLLEAQLNPIPPAAAEAYADAAIAPAVFHVFAGQNVALEAESAALDAKAIEVARNYYVNLGPNSLFTNVLVDGSYTVNVGAVASTDATALRLQLDLSLLASDDEVYAIDPNGPRAFGPYTAADAAADGTLWTNTVEGDTLVLAVRSLDGHLPEVYVLTVAHHFRDLSGELAKGVFALPCNNNIACETDATLQTISSGVGRYTFSSGGGLFLCSGALVNNADTAALEPYFLTANHCIGAQAEAASAEVFWDYRVDTCEGTTPPALNSLLRSNGASLLGTDAPHDGTLIQLDSVQSGAFGRHYLGWSTATPAVGDPLTGIHHPGGNHMRISYGQVTVVEQSTSWQKQIRVEWSDGVTEQGSSGSPLLSDAINFQVIGVLSNGNVHVCPENPTVNFDRYGALRLFFPQIEAYLTGDQGGPTPPTGPCPAKVAFEKNPQALAQLRAWRDGALAKTAQGRALIDLYYEAAPELAKVVRESQEARGLFILAASPFARMGARYTQ